MNYTDIEMDKIILEDDKCYCLIKTNTNTILQCQLLPTKNSKFCNNHYIIYNVLAINVGINNLNKLPRCIGCLKLFNKSNSEYCNKCIGDETKCKWFTARNKEIRRCTKNAQNGFTTCFQHKTYENDDVRLIRVCKKCKKVLKICDFVGRETYNTCNNCNDIVLANMCKYVFKNRNVCTHKKYNDIDFCKNHEWLGTVMRDEQNGIRHCRYYTRGCKAILEPDRKEKACEACLAKCRKYDTIKNNTDRLLIIKENELLLLNNEARCYYCDEIYDLECFKNNKGVIKTTKCKECRKKTNNNESTRKPRKYLERYYEYIKKIKKHKYQTQLTYELSKEYFNTECFYCDDKPYSVGGIDRIVNEFRAYIIINMVPCCRTCNFMKCTKTIENFIKICTHIAIYSGKLILDPNETYNYDYSLFYNSPNTNYYTYKRDAERRGIEFRLSEIEFNNISSQKCNYCGYIKQNLLSGVDRIDSNGIYIKGNVVSACTTCNLLKNDQNIDVFYDKCVKIAKKFRNVNIDDEIKKTTDYFLAKSVELSKFPSQYAHPYHTTDDDIKKLFNSQHLSVMLEEENDDVQDNPQYNKYKHVETFDENYRKNGILPQTFYINITPANIYYKALTNIIRKVKSQKRPPKFYKNLAPSYDKLIYDDNIKLIKFIPIHANTSKLEQIWDFFYAKITKKMFCYNCTKILLMDQNSNKYCGIVAISFNYVYSDINNLYKWDQELFHRNNLLNGIILEHIPLGSLEKIRSAKNLLYNLLFSQEMLELLSTINKCPILSFGVLYPSTYICKTSNKKLIGQFELYQCNEIDDNVIKDAHHFIKSNNIIPYDDSRFKESFNLYTTMHVSVYHMNPISTYKNLWHCPVYDNSDLILSQYCDIGDIYLKEYGIDINKKKTMANILHAYLNNDDTQSNDDKQSNDNKQSNNKQSHNNQLNNNENKSRFKSNRNKSNKNKSNRNKK